MAASARTTDTLFIRRIAVIGAGLMGHGIAQDFARAGFGVTITDTEAGRLTAARDLMRGNLELMADHGRVAPGEIDAILERVHASQDLAETVREADLVIEAVTESLPLKQELFRQLDALAPAGAILASNTSTFMPSSLAAHTARPAKVVVAHYFNPPYLLPLVELVAGEQTAPETIEALRELYVGMGKQPAVVWKERLGFVGNRLQAALHREALALLEAGVATAEDIDTVIRAGFGRRLSVTGLFGTMDAGGLDIHLAVTETLFPDLDRSTAPGPALRDRVQAGKLGLKSGEGWYRYTPEEVAAVRRRLNEALIAFLSREH
jgi:3-hydroxybutyryl-CoA dehydrogenase